MTILSKCVFVWRQPTLLSGRMTHGPNYLAKMQVKWLTIIIGFMLFHRLYLFLFIKIDVWYRYTKNN